MDHSTEHRKLALVAELARSRSAIGRDWAGLRYEADLVGKTKRSIRGNMSAWLTGAAFSGLILSVLPGRRAKQPRLPKGAAALAAAPVARSWLWPVMRTLMVIAKPALLGIAAKIAARQADRFRP